MRTMIEAEEKEAESEVTLGMTSLLGIFFGLVLICGVFFGFGYSLGHSKTSTTATPTASATTPSEDAPSTPAVTHTPKPSGQESLAASSSADATGKPPQYDYVPEEGGPARKPVAGATATPKPSPAAKPSAAQTETPATPFALQPAVVSTATTPPPALKKAVVATPAVQPAPTAGGATMVQIAAVSHQEDADVLVSALKKRGYNVVVRNETQDKLLHVQVGPFASRDEARTMRTKLQSDGYNAILKP